MPEPVENYTPQDVLADLKRNALKPWSVVVLVSFAWVGIILFAPIAKSFGLMDFANPIYSFYSYICHQIPSRSFYIFEHQFAVCSRCFGVYLGLFVGLASYPLFRSMDEIDPFPRIWLILSMIPIGIDWALTFFGVWENTHLTRVVSGLILGFACAVYIVPAIVELTQMRMIRKFKKART